MALSKDRKTDRMGVEDSVIPQVLSFPVAANTKIYGGSMVATDAAGNAVPASASTALKLWGRCELQIDNTGGNAGDKSVDVRPGAYYFASGLSGDAIVVADRGLAAYASDDFTVNLTDGGGTRPFAGTILDVRADGQVAVLVGISLAYAQQPSEVVRYTVDLPLATIQGKTSGAAFNLGSVLPTNARLLGCEVNVIAVITGGTISAMSATVQGGSDAAGTIIGATDAYTATGVFATAGSNPYQSRGGQQLHMTLTATGDTLAHATAGHLSVDLFYAIVG